MLNVLVVGAWDVQTQPEKQSTAGREADCQSSMYKQNKQQKKYISQVMRLLIARIHLLFQPNFSQYYQYIS